MKMTALFLTLGMAVAAQAQTPDWTSTSGQTANQDHLIKGALKTFFQVYGGYEHLSQMLDKNNGIFRGFIGVKGSGSHLVTAGNVTADDFVLVPFEARGMTDGRFFVQVAVGEKQFTFKKDESNNMAGNLGLRLKVGTFELDRSQSWGTVKRFEVFRATPMFSQNGHRVNFSFGLPVETGAIWTNISGFQVDGQKNGDADQLKLFTWQAQLYLAAKVDMRLTSRSRIGGIFQMTAFTYAPTYISGYAENGVKHPNYSEWDQTWKVFSYNTSDSYQPSDNVWLPDGKNSNRRRRADFDYYKQSLKNMSFEAYYGVSFGKRRNREIQFVVKGLINQNQNPSFSANSLPGAVNPVLAGKDEYRSNPEKVVIDWGNGNIEHIPTEDLPSARVPGAYQNKKITLMNPSQIQFGIRLKL